ncbi:MAG TPA: DNA-binding protein [Cyanobacteria bacterium UBA11049]|nr:DNA-binding protein [Cyanobacteria bacterium UBA11049]
MRVLVDTNIVLDALLEREPFFRDAKALLKAIENHQIQGYITATTLTDIFYIARKNKGIERARLDVSDLLALMQICTVDRSILETAVSSNLSDFEDAVQLACAVSNNLNAIATRDAQGFVDVSMQILSAGELLQQM